MRQDDEESSLEARLGETPLEMGQIVPHQRPDIGVDDRGRDPLIFLDLRQHIARPGNADAGQFAREALRGGKFMRRVEIGMQKAHRHRRGAGRADRGDGVVKRPVVEWRDDIAIGLEPFLHAKPPLARHQRFGRRRAQIVAVVLETFAHFDHVAMALGSEQRDVGALALQQGIGRDRRAVNDSVCHREHVRARQLQPPRQLIQPGHDADRLIQRGRGRFREHGLATLVDGNEIRVGAADVDPDREHHRESCAVVALSCVRPCSRSR